MDPVWSDLRDLSRYSRLVIRQAHGASALRHGYLVKNAALNTALRLRDAWLRASRPRGEGRTVVAPRRLLVCVGGHLGDAVIATSVLPALRGAYPEAELGVLAPSWSQCVFENHPAVRWRHALDHWKTNRAASTRARWASYRRSTERARNELRSVGYDTAIDLYPFFPNAASTLAAAAVPIRIGYSSGGSGPLYTHALPWIDTKEHTMQQHRTVMRAFLPGIPTCCPQYDLPPLDQAAEASGRVLVRSLGIAEVPYVVIHPGAGDARKLWPSREWRALVDRLRHARPDARIVFTGHGASESSVVAEIRSDDESLLSACGRTSWGQLRYLLANAALVIGVDSVAVHLAAADGVPCVAIMTAMSDPAHWRPYGSRVRVLTNAVPCAPCFRSKGCASMSCVRGVTVDAVEHAAETLLEAAVS